MKRDYLLWAARVGRDVDSYVFIAACCALALLPWILKGQ